MWGGQPDGVLPMRSSGSPPHRHHSLRSRQYYIIDINITHQHRILHSLRQASPFGPTRQLRPRHEGAGPHSVLPPSIYYITQTERARACRYTAAAAPPRP